MTMKTYEYVEDYLEVIAGKRDIVKGVMHPSYIFSSFTPIINLARYDVGFLDSVTDATLTGSALTDRQAELAVKLINKYQRQLTAKGIALENIEIPKYRKTLRVIDRTRMLSINKDHMVLKFPYDSKLIEGIRAFLKQSQGGGKFDKDAKEWHMELSEFNVNWLYTWTKSNGFAVDDKVESIMADIITVEQTEYKIELDRVDGKLTITNAPNSMIEYIEAQGVSFDDTDIVRLADMSSVLQYTISESVMNEVVDLIGPQLAVFVSKREYELTGDADQIDRLYRYAQLVNRLPMVVYDPSPKGSIELYKDRIGTDVIYNIGNQRVVTDLQGKMIVWSHRPIKEFETIPMLVSHVGLMAGAEKAIMLQNAQKIIYFNHKLTPG